MKPAGDVRSAAGEAWLLYDGECPFCSAYVQLMRLREAIGELQLRDARTHPDLIAEAAGRGLAVDTGMILKLDGRYYHGADCMHRLALLATPSGRFNRINRLIFSSKTATRLLYPLLRGGRALTLQALGRKRIAQAQTPA